MFYIYFAFKVLVIISLTFIFAYILNDQVYFIEKRGTDFVRLSEKNYLKTLERFPPNITAAVKGPGDQIYFFRHDQFCKRELDGRKSNLKPPQFV